MLFYDIKLVNTDTNEIYYQVVSPKPQLPSKDLLMKHAGAMIVISTTSGPEMKVITKVK